MAANAPQCCDCGWLLALCEKLQDTVKLLEAENDHLKDMLWKSSGSWAEKEQAIEDDIILASEEVVNERDDEKDD